MRLRQALSLSLFVPTCGSLAGCADLLPASPGTDAAADGGTSPSTPGPKTERVASCDDAPDGTPCGSPAEEKHCIFDACIENACGDGFRAGHEECDDGDENGGDGCSALCRREECGNGRLDVGEACDDGDEDDGDGCSATCEVERPGMDAGLADGPTLDGDTSDGDADLCFAGLEFHVEPTVHPENARQPGLVWQWVGLTHSLTVYAQGVPVDDGLPEAGPADSGVEAEGSVDGGPPPLSLADLSIAWTGVGGAIVGSGVEVEYRCDEPTTTSFVNQASLVVTRPGTDCPPRRYNVQLGCVRPPQPESCGNGMDDDLDGEVDCDDEDCVEHAACQAEVCDDGEDNDDDGDVDCQDSECSGAAECAEVCDGGVDNDQDGNLDCADGDCMGDAACAETDCGDQTDNDGDELVDCDDSDCARDAACVESDCSNGEDDDGDGEADCADADCAGDAICVESDCSNGEDDDGDGDADCEDDDCAEDAACQNGDPCRDCVDAACSDYQGSGISLVDACFYEGAPVQGSPTPQPEFAQLCIDAYECSLNSSDSCFRDGLGPGRCACGSREITECQTEGPADDAQCPDEWAAAAARCDADDWMCVLSTFTEFTQPAGYANFTIECTNESCASECFP